MTEREIYKKALSKFGSTFQMDMMIEECAELIHAIMKYRRNCCLDSIVQVEEELADVEIMLEQMKLIGNRKNIQAYKEAKLLRLEKLL